MYFENLPGTSRIWIYTSNKSLADLKNSIEPELKEFVSKWAAHGNQLFGDGAIINNYFIVLAVDESRVGASGCSIDSSVGFIRSLGAKYDIDFFDRMNILIQNEGEDQMVRFTDLKDSPGCMIYDPMIGTLGELRSSWLKPIESTPYV